MVYPKIRVVSWLWLLLLQITTELSCGGHAQVPQCQQPGGQRSVDKDISKVDLASMFRWLAIPKLQQKEHTTHPAGMEIHH